MPQGASRRTADHDHTAPCGVDTTAVLDDYLADGVTVDAFDISRDVDSTDHIDAVEANGRELRLQPNRLGHIHGSATRTRTVCALTAMSGGDREERDSQPIIAGKRTPLGLDARNVGVMSELRPEATAHFAGVHYQGRCHPVGRSAGRHRMRDSSPPWGAPRASAGPSAQVPHLARRIT